MHVFWFWVRIRNQHGWAGVLLCTCACALLAGCGSRDYQGRLDETVKYFAYLEKVNAALSPQAWTEAGIELRAPKQFQLIPPPEIPEATEENGVEISEGPPVNDERQPKYLSGVQLPGMQGAWRATIPADSGEGNLTAHIYVLSNYQRWLDVEDDATVEPLDFFDDFSQQIASGLQVAPPTEEDVWNWQEDWIPPKGKPSYVAKKNYETLTMSQQINNVMTDFIMYRYSPQNAKGEDSGIQMLVLFVIPQGVDPRLRLPQAIGHCLEWLKVSPETPTKRKQQAGGAAAF